MKSTITAAIAAIFLTTSVAQATVPEIDMPSVDVSSSGDSDVMIGLALLAILGLVFLTRDRDPQTCPMVSDQTYTGGKADTAPRPTC